MSAEISIKSVAQARPGGQRESGAWQSARADQPR